MSRDCVWLGGRRILRCRLSRCARRPTGPLFLLLVLAVAVLPVLVLEAVLLAAVQEPLGPSDGAAEGAGDLVRDAGGVLLSGAGSDVVRVEDSIGSIVRLLLCCLWGWSAFSPSQRTCFTIL